jgi:thioredoxin reductase (NADPH)
MTSSTTRNVIIVGSGPAGLTAAIYTARANLAPLVIEGEPSSTSDQPGGQLMLTTDVENFPGFPDGIMGPELMQGFRRQAERFGAEFLTEKATSVDLSDRPFKVHVRDTVYEADSVIVSTGARSLMLGLDAESRLLGHGLSTCATCDGFFFRGHQIAVVGGGDSALEEAMFLTKFAEKVTLIHRRDSLRASKIMQDRAYANPKIEFMWNTVVDDLVGTDSLEGAVVRDVETGATSTLPVTGLFVAIGHRPNTDLFTGVLDMDENGYLVTKPDSSYTNIEGVFACGDVQDHTYRQAITAAGSGCMAAIDAERWLEGVHHEREQQLVEVPAN